MSSPSSLITLYTVTYKGTSVATGRWCAIVSSTTKCSPGKSLPISGFHFFKSKVNENSQENILF